MKNIKLFILSIILCVLLSGCSSNSNTLKINSLDDFSHKKIGIQTGTLYENFVYELIPESEIEFYTDPNAMLLALSQGKLDAYVTDKGAALFEQQQYPQIKFYKEPLQIVPISIGIGETPQKDLLISQINEFINNSDKNGVLNDLETYWVDNYNEDKNATDKSGITGENGVIVVGMEGNYVPFSYFNNQEPEGYDVDFIYRFCREYGYEPVIEMMDYDALSPALSSGKCHLATNIIYDEERNESVSLSRPFYNSKVIIGYFTNSTNNAFSIQKIYDSFNKTFIKDSRWQQFINGAIVSLIISASSIILGTIFGLILYIICRKGPKILNAIVDKVSWIVEGTPTVLLLMIFYFIIFGNVNIEKIIVAIIVFSLILTISMFSMLKSGEIAVGGGQLEAALSQGFSDFKAYILIVLPQSAIHFLPQYCSELVSLIKETSIVGYIAILDLTKVSDMIRGRTFEPFFPLISTAVIYFILSWLLTLAAKKLHKSLSPETRNIKDKFKNL